MFLVDKYKAKQLSDILIHKDIYSKLVVGFDPEIRKRDLKKLDLIVASNNYNLLCKYHNERNPLYNMYYELQNLLIHGPDGSGKHTLINLLLTDIYGDDINLTQTISYDIKNYSNTNKSIEIKQSKYHMVIEPTNSAFDKYIIQEIVKNYAQELTLQTEKNQYPFRIVLIDGIDNLHYYAQTSLRCTMEKYHKTCRFILCGKQTSKIIDPIKSRCVNVRITAPTKNEILSLIMHILISENKMLTDNKISEIIKLGNFNIKTILWMLNTILLDINNFALPWETLIDNLVNSLIEFKKNTTKLTQDIVVNNRKSLYDIFMTNIPLTKVLTELINKLILSESLDPDLLYDILQIGSIVELRLNKGKRGMQHIELFITKTREKIYKFYNPKIKNIII